MMEKKYIPIDCNLYDIFTEAAVLKKPLALKIQLSEGDLFVTDFVVDLITEQKVEYIILAKLGRHRLDTVMLTQG